MRALALFSILLGVAGCREGVGKRCQSSNDCHAGLVCILPIGGSPQTGGVCTDVKDMGEPDQSVALDLAGEDQAVPADAASAEDDLL